MVLHDHLDGGLRPATILQLAEQLNYQLPASDEAGLADWFDQTDSGSLESYLEAFTHTVGVMQTGEALHRVAREAVLDHDAEGVIYGEIRFAPKLHTARGLDAREAVAAVLEGLERGTAETGCRTGLILVAMRDRVDSLEVAQLAIAFRDQGVVGFDLAGPERGFPPDDHIEACTAVLEGGVGLTIHAGEGYGPKSVKRALNCGAQRLGHGIRIVEDCRVQDGEITDLGPIAARVHSSGVPLEVCVTSNVHTKLAEAPETHPMGMLHRAGFNVTINSDNRLMSRTDMTREFEVASRHHDFEIDDLSLATERAIRASFSTSETQQEALSQLRSVYRSLDPKSVTFSQSTTSSTT